MPNSGDDSDDASNWQNRRAAYLNSPVVQVQADPAKIGRIIHQNDLYTMYNLPPGMPPNFTMMPVGHGNYLQVFHQADGPEQQQQVFNSYELFAPNSFIPHQPGMHQMQQPPEQQQQQAQVPNSPDMSQSPQNHHNNDSVTNMFINRLVTNWKPNVSGTYSPFGEQHSHLKAFNHVFDTSSSAPSSSSLSLPSASQTSFESSQASLLADKSFSSAPGNLNVAKTNGNLENNGVNAPEVRKRIVAEVKPMRMSYSDVLSKNVAINQKPLNETSGGNYSSSSESNMNQSNKSSKSVSEKAKPGQAPDDKKPVSVDGKEKYEVKSKKFESQNSFRNDDSSGSSYTNLQKDKRKSNGEESSREAGSNSASKTAKKSTQSVKGKPKTPSSSENTKRRSYKRDMDDEVFLASTSAENEKEFYYNVAKTESSFDRQPKNSQYSSNSTKKSRLTPSSQKSSFRSAEKPTYYSRRSQKSRKDTKYELLMKLAEKWYEYTLKVLTWLFYLVYDIVVLGFGMIYDRINNYAISMCSFFVNLRQEFRNNSGKPSDWIKNLFKKIDSKFKKNSKFALWRRFTEKKQSEPAPDFYENGRLPQTGDEAIYSLLNCKGKDAYSILGVTTESSQEQIRKHYKKIAMLVHPDKNKQPGAEEAFKVLQRAFELIGEPENRRTYDKSLAEELDAKKQWSELHDLLSQLQQKIAEAANTIRCSSCGLRHPRKLTERPHYAARECSSCKIRHSAREGDIWTETSIFGLRWRYLALMEGKVYDITEWANCQKGALAYLQPNSHVVQYRIVRGVQEKQQHEKQSKERSKREFGKLLDNIYSGHNPQAQQSATSRRRTKRNWKFFDWPVGDAGVNACDDSYGNE